MTYPRSCPLCGTAYDPTRGGDTIHVTLDAGPSGTPSPWCPELPGRVLTLHCLACDGDYRWDYFASTAPSSATQALPRAPRRDVRGTPRPITLRGSRPRSHRRRAG
jgi:hypothetical protein